MRETPASLGMVMRMRSRWISLLTKTVMVAKEKLVLRASSAPFVPRIDEETTTLYVEAGWKRSPAVRVQTTPVVPSAEALPLTALPVMASTTLIESFVIDAGSMAGVNDARMFVVSETSRVTVPKVSAACDGGVPLKTTTLPRTGGCGTSVRSTREMESGSIWALCVYGAPSPVEVKRGTSVNGAAGFAGTGTL